MTSITNSLVKNQNSVTYYPTNNNDSTGTVSTQKETSKNNPVAEKVETTLKDKPAEMSVGEYLNRQALNKIGERKGFDSTDIDLEIQYVKDKEDSEFIDSLKFGKTKIEKPNDLTNKQVDDLIKNGHTKVNFGIHQSTLDRIDQRNEIVNWIAGRDALKIPVSEQDMRDLEAIGYKPEDVKKLLDTKYMQYQGTKAKVIKEVNDIAKQKLIAERIDYLTENSNEVIKDGDDKGATRLDFLIRSTATNEINQALANSKMTPLEYLSDNQDYEKSLAELKAWQERTGKIPTSTYVKEFGKNALNSLLGSVGEAVKGLSIIAVNTSLHLDKDGNVVRPNVSDSLGYKLGDWIQENVQIGNVNKDVERTFIGGVLPKTIGGLLPAVFGGWVTKAPKAFVAIYGALQTGGNIYDEAKKGGATESQAQTAALLTGGFVGLTDRIGYGKTLETLNKSAGAETWKQIFKEAVKDGGRNAGVAGVQTIFENGVAKNIYDPNRGYLDNIEQRMLAAGITGAALKGGLEIIAKVRTGRNPSNLAETQKIFNVEPKAKSQVELNAKQIEYRNSGNNLKNKLNRQVDEKEAKTKTEKTIQNTKLENQNVKPTSNEQTRAVLRKRLFSYEFTAKEIEQLKVEKLELKNIPTEDLVALKTYTGGMFEYVNDTLRTKNPIDLKDIDSIVKCANSGLHQISSYKGVAYRGVNFNNLPDVLAKYKKGEILTEEAFTSSSIEKSASHINKDTMMIIYSKNGKDISFLSNVKNEKEILFKSNSKFIVESVQTNSEGKREIIMREINEDKK